MREDTKKRLFEILSQERAMTTQEIANLISLSRSVTSLYLNELLERGEVIKSGKKPVYWSLIKKNTQQNDVFNRYIGSEGSAKKAIENCKAAVLYPPLGLPLLLYGPSGVGKSFLAKLIFEYLKKNKVEGAQKFIVFNCADYANNPELLSSILFGHAKGAFTGAEKSKKGLLVQANKGVLFLDEVHRLSYENQEKLFQFMDTGKFRPVGEESEMVCSEVRLLFATTEPPEKVLLPTFYRRIPVIIELPSFHERPIFERIKLIKVLFEREAQQLKKSLIISNSIYANMIRQELPGNIGSLANQVKMACADALRLMPYEPKLIIGSEEDAIEIKYPLTQRRSDRIFELLKEKVLSLFDINDILEFKASLEEINKKYLIDITSIEHDYLLMKIKKSIQTQSLLLLGDKVRFINEIEIICNIIQLLKEDIKNINFEQKYHLLENKYPRTVLLSKNLSKNIPFELESLVRFLLSINLIGKVSEDIHYHALLVAHGDATATSIQAVANKMCGDYIFDAINMPLSSSVRDIILEVNIWLEERDTSKGVIMLVDMGSLTHLYKSLKPKILGELLVINNLTTSYALEIGQLLINGNLFFEIARTAEEKFVTQVQYFEGFSVEKNVIISSISGRDVAKKIKEICIKYFNPDIKLIVVNYSELINILERASAEKEYLKRTELIMTTSYLDNFTNVSNINLLDFLDKDAEKESNEHLINLIHPSSVPLLIKEFIYFFSKEGLSEKLEFLNPDVVIQQVEDIVDKCEERFNLQLNAKMKVNLMMHFALMIERTILKADDYEVPKDINKLQINNKPFYNNIQIIFYSIEQFYRIKISNWESYIIYEILLGRKL